MVDTRSRDSLSKFELIETDGVFTLKNLNTTLGFVRFNNKGEIEYIFVNPLFRKQNLAKELLKLVKKKLRRKLFFKNQLALLVKNY